MINQFPGCGSKYTREYVNDMGKRQTATALLNSMIEKAEKELEKLKGFRAILESTNIEGELEEFVWQLLISHRGSL